VAEAAALAEAKTKELTAQLETLEQVHAGMETGVTFCNNMLRDASAVDMLTIKAKLLARLETIAADYATLHTAPVNNTEILFSSTADAALSDELHRMIVRTVDTPPPEEQVAAVAESVGRATEIQRLMAQMTAASAAAIAPAPAAALSRPQSVSE
jgi:hypothetical protein